MKTANAVIPKLPARSDAIVGDLLFGYANLLKLTDTMENAAAIYDLALRYGTPRAELARQRMAKK